MSLLSRRNPAALKQALAARAKELRLFHGHSRAVLEERSGVPASTIKRFETTGDISLESLLRLAVALEAAEGFEGLFPVPEYRSLDEVVGSTVKKVRKRGRRRS